MTVNLNTLIGTNKLMATIQNPSIGLADAFDPKFFSIRENADSQTFKWEQVPITQTTAAAVNFGSPARNAPRTSNAERDARCIHLFESITHGGQALLDLESDSAETRERAARDFTKQAVNFGLRFNNSEKVAVASALAFGAIYQSSSGHFQHTSSGAARTIDLGVPAANKNQLAGKITASWATAGTDILGNLFNIFKAAAQTGFPIRKVQYGSAVPGYFRGNTAISTLMGQSPMLADNLMQGRIPKGFGDPTGQVVWEPIWNEFFVDSGGTTREIFASDNVLFLPEVTNQWYTMVDGAVVVPTEVGLSATPDAAKAKGKKVYGKFSYAATNHNPYSVDQFCGHSFLPVFLNPAAFFIADVVP